MLMAGSDNDGLPVHRSAASCVAPGQRSIKIWATHESSCSTLFLAASSDNEEVGQVPLDVRND